jgi:hypothetical protein
MPPLDLGPFVGLWYAAVSVQALRLRNLIGRQDTDGSRAPAAQAGALNGET